MTGSENDSKDEHWAALVTLNATTFKLQRTVLMIGDAIGDEQRTFYKSLLKISWLAPKIRQVIMKELGLSLRAMNANVNHGRAIAVWYLVAELKARMKKNGKRPRGGLHEAAVTEIARRQDMTVAALKKLLQRHGPDAEVRRKLQVRLSQQVADGK